jgi:Zn-dependent peptidase ImmA (M78 family)
MSFTLDATATQAGWVHLEAVVNDEVVWPHPHQVESGSDFDPEDVLSWLTDAWPYLLLEQSWPVTFHRDQEPRSITGLLRAAEERWENADTDYDQEAEAAALDRFLYSHDLRQMKHGAGLGACFVLRQHHGLRIETHGQVYEDLDFGTFVKQLSGLGTLAARLLRKRTDQAAVRLLERWKAREQIDPLDAASYMTGLPRLEIEALPDLVTDFTEALGNRKLSEIANDNTGPIPAAARASGVLGPAGLAEILRRIKAVPNGDMAGIETKRRQLRRQLRDIPRPLDQGIRAASLVRQWFEATDDTYVDLHDMSARLGIQVRRSEIPDSRLDGIAVVGPQHGPAIVLNTNTRRQGAGRDDLERSLRFTWAHEIGHLLLDHGEWAALIDATRQRVPRSVESRANAFATYLLLPHGAASRAWDGAGSPVDWPGIMQVLNELTVRFMLPRINASRQLAREIPPERRKLLDPVLRTNIENFDGR